MFYSLGLWLTITFLLLRPSNGCSTHFMALVVLVQVKTVAAMLPANVERFSCRCIFFRQEQRSWLCFLQNLNEVMFILIRVGMSPGITSRLPHILEGGVSTVQNRQGQGGTERVSRRGKRGQNIFLKQLSSVPGKCE
ncbi:hypothetical protein ILYODFUR_025647 [Ilyodon furcidens]|uniref:Secreted protein n=1 Tax=Ilyodon furcidens TaxID=33524 RepID=A0ABV0V6S6_9TELE